MAMLLLAVAFAVAMAVLLTRGRTGGQDDAMKAWLRTGLVLLAVLMGWLLIMVLGVGPAMRDM